MHNYAGNPAVYPANVGLVDDADLNPATAATLDVSGENLADRTANLQAHKLTKDGTDTLTGTVTVNGGGKIDIAVGGELDLEGLMEVHAGTINLHTGTNVVGFSGSLVTIQPGSEIDVAGTLKGLSPASIQANIAGGITSEVAGGINLNGGSTDFPTFPVRTKQTRKLAQAINPLSINGTDWTYTGPFLTGGATVNGLYLRIPGLHQGAVLAAVSVEFVVVAAHSSVPTNLPSLRVQRLHILTGSVVGSGDELSTTATHVFPTPGSAAAYVNGHALWEFSYLANQNNIIDVANYTYWVFLTDENGSGSVAGNLYYSVTANYTNIADMRFQDGG